MRKGPRSIGKKTTATISLCMIVKNEAATLERCLAGARPYVDEIILVDTGSTDETIEIAEKYADVLDEIEWPGSFSAARNYSIDLASGDYIMVLDGDEYLEGEEAWANIRHAIGKRNVVSVQLPVLNLLPEGDVVHADRLWQERLFLNRPQLRYAGKVHNQIQDAIVAFMDRTGYVVRKAEAEIVHTGYAYAKERMKEKYRPRLSLLIDEYENPRSPKYRSYYGYQLGLVYYVLQEYENALEIFNDIDYSQLIGVNAFYTHMLGAQTALRLKRAPDALLHAEGMLSTNRAEPVGYFVTGLTLLLAQQIIDGLLMLVEAFNVSIASGGSERFVLNHHVLLAKIANVLEQVNAGSYASALRDLADRDTLDTQSIQALIEMLKLSLVQLEMKQKAA